ncbi:thioredoxin family protein [Bordetella pseudohinzii]|uniref:Thioredoxin n=1 Tax=Bordetella pseudohinzii TaxID=1331258 RepID=A0A0J6C4E8_9BORD|nr:thioredoxin family protein [Bordetella pseudohinzii]ANY17414.1 thiol reductase thioredoxin [Bordetella pseudohinzii]KMM25631.1 thiol-disulfide isomerase [Bordetella pseudohinzii]KXA81630.1 thiol-disulfide isomerase [Bordetella pseudohinzii]KXA83129.1 thiol-disulfide isomerase [Bordetella pseudohinzii]CUI70584.1 Thioredoxin [Bordetella pseudohinzii]
MPLLLPGTDSESLRQALARPDSWLVACFCAAWCDTCQQYRPKLEALAQARPEHVFAWIDIEDHPDLLGDEDVENFPTLLVQAGGRTLFYGTMLPHIGHLERLLDSLAADAPGVKTALPDVPALLSRA